MKTVREALFVIGLSIIVAGVVNAVVNPHPLPWLHEERDVTQTSDASLDSLLGSTTGSLSSGQTSASQSAQTPSYVTAQSGLSSTPTQNTVSVTAPKTLSPQNVSATVPGKSIAIADTKKNPGVESPAKTSGSNSEASAAAKLPLSVNYEQVVKLLATPGVTFIDARKVEEHEKAALKNSLNVDMVQFPEDPGYRDQSMRLLYSLPKDRPVVAYCGGGNCELSHELCDVLIQMGFSKVFIYLGGWTEYSEKQGLK